MLLCWFYMNISCRDKSHWMAISQSCVKKTDQSPWMSDLGSELYVHGPTTFINIVICDVRQFFIS